MGAWVDHVVPRITNKVMDTARLREVRDRACTGLAGEVVEIGFGSGLNLPHYPAQVTRVVAVEPSELGWRLAAPRLATARVPVQRGGLDGQRLPFADGSFDMALSTFSLCTIPRPEAALAEMRRVLRPGGVLHFAEHGRAPDGGVHRWQRRLEPVNKRIAGGCHLARPIDELVAAAGFTIERLDRCYLPGEPRPFAALYEGRARA